MQINNNGQILWKYELDRKMPPKNPQKPTL